MPDNELLTKRRRQLRYRANHRGIKEMDIILGGFAQEGLETMDKTALDQFEALIEQNDRDLLQWFTAEKLPPQEFDTIIFRTILDHALSNLNSRNPGI